MAVDRGLPILIVDDYRTMLRIVRNLLRQVGFTNVDEATDGSVALAKLKDRPYGLVISDWAMHPMNGLELLHAMRQDRRLAAIPFIMVTAERRDEHVVRAKDAGVDGYVVKPFNAESLQTEILHVLRASAPRAMTQLSR